METYRKTLIEISINIIKTLIIVAIAYYLVSYAYDVGFMQGYYQGKSNCYREVLRDFRESQN
jgi:hypothetical protein